jgi:hypothetical protein
MKVRACWLISGLLEEEEWLPMSDPNNRNGSYGSSVTIVYRRQPYRYTDGETRGEGGRNPV